MIRQDFFWHLFKKINTTLKLNPHLSLSIKFQSFDKFNCSQCGHCCINPNGVMVTQDFYERWENELSQSSPHKDVLCQFENSTPNRFGWIKNQSDNQRCSFLEDNHTCYIHRQFGADAKPIACQLYPTHSYFFDERLKISQLIPTCKSVPALWAEEAEFSYDFIELLPQSQMKEKNIDIFAYHLWLGIVFDHLSVKQSTIHNLINLTEFLKYLTQLEPEVISESTIIRAYSTFHNGEPPKKNTSLKHLVWLLKFIQDAYPAAHTYLYRHIIDKQNWNDLKIPPNPLVKNYLRNYLLHYSLTYRMDNFQSFDLVKEYIVMLVKWTLLQLVLIFEYQFFKKNIDIELISQVSNHVSKAIAQSKVMIKAQQGREDMFELADTLLNLCKSLYLIKT